MGARAEQPAVAPRLVARLARELVPRLVGRLEELGERYQGLARSVARGTEVDPGLLADLDLEEERGTRLGFVLGVLAAAQGTDVLRVRRDPGSARTLVELLFEGTGAALSPSIEALPDVEPHAGGGWEGAFALGTLFQVALEEGAGGVEPAGRARPEDGAPRTVAWSLAHGPAGWSLAFPGLASGARALWDETVAELAGLGVRAAGEHALLPGGWLGARTSGSADRGA